VQVGVGVGVTLGVGVRVGVAVGVGVQASTARVEKAKNIATINKAVRILEYLFNI
jgi:hypothetical protein